MDTSNVKAVLFGKQKQANVINDSVVKIISTALSKAYPGTNFDSEDSVIAAIEQFLNDGMNFQCHDDQVIMLLIGPESFNVFKSEGPKVVVTNQPNPESPKRTFRIYALGNVDEATVEVNAGGPVLITPDLLPITDGVEKENYKTRVEDLLKQIQPLVPEAVKKELEDPYQQALCCAEYFYSL